MCVYVGKSNIAAAATFFAALVGVHFTHSTLLIPVDNDFVLGKKYSDYGIDRLVISSNWYLNKQNECDQMQNN